MLRKAFVMSVDAGQEAEYDGSAPSAFSGATWAVSWPRGEHAAGTDFQLTQFERGAK